MKIKFTEIDLKKPLQPIYVDTRYSRLFVLVCWGYLPIGMFQLACQPNLRTFSVEQLQNEILKFVGWQLWEQAVAGTLNDLKGGTAQSFPPISVVVCTRDRALSLERCLQALADLDYPNYEVVVVDNCSQDKEVREVVNRRGFHYVREDKSGLNWARNRGIKEVKFNIIAYIDDDALAARGWLRGIAKGFEDPDVMVVTGMVLSSEFEALAQIAFESYGGMSKGFIGHKIKRDELSKRDLFWASNWGVGANMAFRRTLFEAIGNFDVALDVGTPTNGGGDVEFFYRAVAVGYTLCYEPIAMVQHVHRRDNAALMRQVYNNGRSFATYLLTIVRNEPYRCFEILWFALRWWIWDWQLRRLFIGIIKRDRETLRLALTELKGCSSAPWAYWKSRKIALLLMKDNHL
ncbi:MAG: glycosyltransferase [Candidatus Scalinduaceae bacterium]